MSVIFSPRSSPSKSPHTFWTYTILVYLGVEITKHSTKYITARSYQTICFRFSRREAMKSTVVFVVLTILGSLCQGKPVNRKKAAKLKDKPKQGKEKFKSG